MGYQRGFTLVEMMVALVVGLIVMAGIGQVFIHSKRTAAVQDELSRLQESGRYALYMLQENILKAGYLGCGQVANLDGNITSSGSYGDNFSFAVTGHEATGSTWEPSLPAELNEDIVAGTDVLTIRFAEGNGLRMTRPKEAPYIIRVNNTSLESGACPGGQDGFSGLCQGDQMIISDCTKARTFGVQSLTLNGGELWIYHGIPGWGDPADLDPNNHFNPAYGYLFKAVTISYFIRLRDSGTGIPSLYRKIGNRDAEELVEGVENMQVLYGVDSDGDNIPNQFLAADSISDFRQVVSVRLALLQRTIGEKVNRPAATKRFTLLGTDIVTPSDRHIRKIFSTTIQLRNREL